MLQSRYHSNRCSCTKKSEYVHVSLIFLLSYRPLFFLELQIDCPIFVFFSQCQQKSNPFYVLQQFHIDINLWQYRLSSIISIDSVTLPGTNSDSSYSGGNGIYLYKNLLSTDQLLLLKTMCIYMGFPETEQKQYFILDRMKTSSKTEKTYQKYL